MKRRLFLTGPIGCGKSTAIAAALGDRLPHCGGLLTRRHRDPWLRFTLESQLNYTLIERSQGGAGGSTSVLTQRGKELLQRYNAYEKHLKEQANVLYEEYFGGLFE